MARSKSPPPEILASMKEMYFQNIETLSDIARVHGVSVQALTNRIRREEWPRRPKSDHAEAVASKFEEKLAKEKADRVKAQTSVGLVTEENRAEMLEAAVNQDVEDMNLGLAAARSSLKKAHEMIEAIDVGDTQASHLKALCDSTRVSVDTIRKIRGLDEKEQDDELSSMSIEQLKAELERIS